MSTSINNNIFKGIVKLNKDQYKNLQEFGSITVNGITYNYDQNTLYVTDEDDLKVDIGLDSTSDNPVANSAVTAKIDEINTKKLDAMPNGTVSLLDNNYKININYLPANILGALVYGGIISDYAEIVTETTKTLELTLKLSGAAKAKLIVSDDEIKITSDSENYNFEGMYFISAVDASLKFSGLELNHSDWLIGIDNHTWQKIDTSDAVSSVAGKTGAVVLTTADISGLNDKLDELDVSESLKIINDNFDIVFGPEAEKLTLETNAKTIIGAINENTGNISRLQALDTDVSLLAEISNQAFIVTESSEDASLQVLGFKVGQELSTPADYQTIFGKYNSQNPDALYIIGAGNSAEERHNALEVLRDGSVLLGKDAKNDNEAVRLSQVRSLIENGSSGSGGSSNESVDLGFFQSLYK